MVDAMFYFQLRSTQNLNDSVLNVRSYTVNLFIDTSIELNGVGTVYFQSPLARNQTELAPFEVLPLELHHIECNDNDPTSI